VEESLLDAALLADVAKLRMEKTVADVRRLAPVLLGKLGELETVAGMKHDSVAEERVGKQESERGTKTENSADEGNRNMFVPDVRDSGASGPVGDIVSGIADRLSYAVSSLEEDIESVVGAKSRMNDLYERIARLMEITESKLPPASSSVAKETSENGTEDGSRDSTSKSAETKNGKKNGSGETHEDPLPALPPGFKHSGGRDGGRPSPDLVYLYRSFINAHETDENLADYLYATRSFQAFVEKNFGKPWEVLTPKERETLARKLLKDVGEGEALWSQGAWNKEEKTGEKKTVRK